jgi:nicotinate-nucleotide adenylyltransferase
MKKVNVALYGGSFDPPHLGHVMVVSHILLNDESIDRVIVMPCFEHLEKAGLTPFETRFAMCEKAFDWLPRTQVSRLEKELGGGSLTVRTVRALKADNPTWNVHVIIGSDLMAHATQWDGWDELLQEATILVIGRAGIPSNSLDKTARPTHTPISPAVSSTEVRDLLAREDYNGADRYLPRGVLDIISGSRLYSTLRKTG